VVGQIRACYVRKTPDWTVIVMSKFRAGASALLVASLAVAGCSAQDPAPEATSLSPSVTDGPEATTEPTESDDAGPTEEPQDEPSIEGPLDALHAVELALQLAVGAAVVELGRDTEGGREVWEVGVLRDDGAGVELYLDAMDGTVVREQPLSLDPEQQEPPAVSAEDAIGIALATVPGTVDELDLGTEMSRVVWEVVVVADAGGEFEIYIDAESGDVLKQERDD